MNGDENDDLLEAKDVYRSRTLAVKANVVAFDRVDVQFPSKEVCRETAAPNWSSWRWFRRPPKCSVGSTQAREVFSDAEIEKFSRKSTIGRVFLVDGCCLSDRATRRTRWRHQVERVNFHVLVANVKRNVWVPIFRV